MFKVFFPYKLHLHIFQLDEYNVGKFLKWMFKHFLVRKIENKKPIIWTSKAKVILSLSIILTILLILIFLVYLGIVGVLLGIVLATQPYLFIIISFYLIQPYEFYSERKIFSATEKKIESLKNLKVIGVTGSYGKTSTKEFLYEILKTKYSVLRTPGSYNTPLGISKVVDLELDDSYDYFLCEMGAYKRGDIKEICDIVHPKYAILTGINEQHLETFGSIENTTKAKFELIDSIPQNGFAVVNGDNELIKNHIKNYDKKIVSYGFSDKKFSIQSIKQTNQGSEFSLILDGKKYKASTRLVGRSNLQNILGAATMSYLLGMESQEIIEAIKNIKAVVHRLEVKKMGNMTIIDDAYNSNVDGFQEAISLLSSFDQPKVLVTPGIVDLGKSTITIHEELGKLLDGIDYIFLVGNSDRTKGLRMGIKDKKKITELKSIKEIWNEIKELKLNNPVVLLENDLPDNY